MANTLEQLIILNRAVLRHLLARESRLLALGKQPINKKIANFVRTHQETSSWTNFLDSLNEDFPRNINVYDLRFIEKNKCNEPRRYRLDSTFRGVLKSYRMCGCGGRMEDAPVVTVEQGQLQGRVVNSPSGKAFYSFQGIPYAKPPLGSLRFKAPQPPEPWEGIRDATSEGNIAAQINFMGTKEYLGDENCLFLNVYTPNLDGEFLPVMVYIHGGGFKFGSGNSSMYGADYLTEKDVVVVTFNYRCGALGFLSLNTQEIPGNAGMKDMVAAIRWVKENIQNFGGNSGNVTVFGESAGGAAVTMLMASPLSKNMISKAIVQSGTGLCEWAIQNNPIENAKNLANALGCESGNIDEILEFLMSTPVKDLVEAYSSIDPIDSFSEKGNNRFGVVVEKEFPGVEAFISEPFIHMLTSGRVAQIPVMIGSTTLEFAFERKSDDLQEFIPHELNVERNSQESMVIAERIKNLYFSGSHTAIESLHEYFQLLSDKLINIAIHRYVQYLVNVTNKPIYYYKFDYVGELNISTKMLHSLGLKHAMHMDELGYLFKNDYQKEVEPTPQDIKMRERMLRLWTNFAKSGNPTPDENHYLTVTWLPVTKDNLYYLNLGSELSLGTNPDKEKMDFWDELYSKYYRIWEHPKTNTDALETKSNEPIIVSHTLIETVTEVVKEPEPDVTPEPVTVVNEPIAPEPVIVSEPAPEITNDPVEVVEEAQKITEPIVPVSAMVDNYINGNFSTPKPRLSNEIKMAQEANGVPKDVIRANDPPEDDLPKNIGVNKFVNFFESLGGKK